MDLTVLYELRERLKSGAIAGTGLLGEDFRLLRALEAMSPLENASAVFQKICQSVRVLLSPDCPDCASALLDALSLCDAVLTTQGAVAVAGELNPIVINNCGNVLTNAPYSLLSPVMDALTKPGEGRHSYVLNVHNEHPEVFKDYRIKNALVEALGGHYSELVETWLYEEDKGIIPLLKYGFDVMGKNEMVRRLRVIESVAGAEENEFYISLVEKSEKELRKAAIYALRHSQNNAERLIDLSKTEKGNFRLAAYAALAMQDNPIAWDYWKEKFKKNPKQVASYMMHSKTDKAGQFVGEALCNFIEPYEAGTGIWNTENANELRKLLHALAGKSGTEIQNFYRRAATLGNVFDAKIEENKASAHFSVSETQYSTDRGIFSEVLPFFLRHNLVLNPDPAMCALAIELYQTYQGAWVAPALTAVLLSKPADVAFEQCQAFIQPSKGKDDKTHKNAIYRALISLSWNAKKEYYYFSSNCWDFILNRYVPVQTKLYGHLDSRWFEELTKRGSVYDDILINILSQAPENIKEHLAKHFYVSAYSASENRKYLIPLRELGWTDYKGFFMNYCKKHSNHSIWLIRQYLEELPSTNAEKLAEIEETLALCENDETNMRGIGLAMLKELIADRL